MKILRKYTHTFSTPRDDNFSRTHRTSSRLARDPRLKNLICLKIVVGSEPKNLTHSKIENYIFCSPHPFNSKNSIAKSIVATHKYLTQYCIKYYIILYMAQKINLIL